MCTLEIAMVNFLSIYGTFLLKEEIINTVLHFTWKYKHIYRQKTLRSSPMNMTDNTH